MKKGSRKQTPPRKPPRLEGKAQNRGIKKRKRRSPKASDSTLGELS